MDMKNSPYLHSFILSIGLEKTGKKAQDIVCHSDYTTHCNYYDDHQLTDEESCYIFLLIIGLLTLSTFS